MTSTPAISILLVTKNGAQYIEETLQAIFSQKLSEPFEVIAIDSSSTDGTLDILRRYPVRLREIASEEFNHGRTRNLGIAMARGEFIVLITQDATPSSESWLEKMLGNFSDPDVAGVYCRQIPRPDADVLTKRQLNGWVTARSCREIKRITDWQRYGSLPPMEQYMFCTFDNVSSCIRQEVWRKYPFPSASFAEDLEWSKKVLEEGYAIVYEPEAAVFHSHHRSVLYEYQRTYLCHRRLYELFRLHTVPTPRQALRAVLTSLLMDSRFVIRNERPLPKTLRLLCRLPLFIAASVLGQFRGARDESRHLPYKTFRRV
ncbi:glycosyl transferase [Candidatus Methylomirabilis lanthanidiphila]|uniref:Glycosyl transferase n=1 Tax=Candidatus Methylomirabilis lanthanidiphila TaxID=2211376 RepID=A0A564ZMB9_9BACT|nr:glycosyltransferase [Candidatus Methylomirabilis lanthanidiphila]VUZ85708.1 glycosyl transferase [Candidatus Methylomirabilis lanthanidiphila]